MIAGSVAKPIEDDVRTYCKFTSNIKLAALTNIAYLSYTMDCSHCLYWNGYDDSDISVHGSH